MDAKPRTPAGSSDRQSSRHRAALDAREVALTLFNRLKSALDAARRPHRTHRHRRYLALPIHEDTRDSRFLEAALLKVGIALMMIYMLVRVDASANGERDLSSFAAGQPDTSLWSASRAEVFRASVSTPPEALAGALSIRSLGLAVPIYADTREVHLNRGVGLIAATAKPGASGNVGIAGHRDGYFRALKDIESGDTIEVITAERAYVYRVRRVAVVERDDAALLRSTDTPMVTLVTCYPFYFVGHAPQRFVVQGELVSSHTREAFVTNRGTDRRRRL
jgi:sortase A